MAALVRSTSRLMRLRPLVAAATQVRGYAEGHEMAFTFASGSQVFYNSADIRQVDVPSFSGSFGILPLHVPTLAMLRPGVVTVYDKDGSTKKFFVSSGSVTVNEDSSVQVLAEEACSVDDLDPSACRDVLSKAQSAAGSGTTEESKAEALIALEVAEALVKACE